MKKVLMTICVLAAMTGFVSASSLDVTGAAALEGSFGMAVTVDNTGVNAYVQDATPAAESIYRATFLIDLNNTFSQATATANGNNFITVAEAISNNPQTPPPVWSLALRMYLMNRTVEPYCRARLGVYSNINQRLLGPPVGIDCDGTVEVTIEWTAGAANTGLARVTSVSPVIGTRVGERVVSNHLLDVSFFSIGHVAGNPPATIAGTIYWDSFESYRTLAP